MLMITNIEAQMSIYRKEKDYEVILNCRVFGPSFIIRDAPKDKF